MKMISITEFKGLGKKERRHEEADMQKACVQWFRLEYPHYTRLLSASLTGAFLQGNAKERAIQWNRLKAMGANSGEADLCLYVPFQEKGKVIHASFFELKTPDGIQSTEQKEFEIAAIQAGYAYFMPRKTPDFINIVNRIIENKI